MTVWKYLQDAPIHNHYFSPHVWAARWGSFLEKLGRRVLISRKAEFGKLFPDVVVVSSDVITNKKDNRILTPSMKMINCDLVIIYHCKNEKGFEKKVVAFEIKSGASPISAKHVAYWRHLLDNPDKYIKKCTEIKLVVMWILAMDVEGKMLCYTLKEVKSDEIPPADTSPLDGLYNMESVKKRNTHMQKLDLRQNEDRSGV